MKININLVYRILIIALITFLIPINIMAAYKEVNSNYDIPNRGSQDIFSTWNNKRYKELGKLLARQIKSDSDLRALYKTASENHANGLKNAILATMNIVSKCKNIKLTKGEILQLALFIETDLKKMVNRNQYYFDSKKFEIPKSIEVDPENGNIIIYLEKKNYGSIGKGKFKTVNRSLLYDIKSPEIVATGFFKIPKDNSNRRERLLREAEVMKKLKGEKGVVKWYSIFNHENVDRNNDELVFVEKLYRGGSIRDILKKHKYSFTKAEKLKLVKDFISGLKTMHERGMTHRDLHTGNYLIDVEKNNNKRKVAGVITDFGRVRFSDNEYSDYNKRNKLSYSQEKKDINCLGYVLHALIHDYKVPLRPTSLKPIKFHGYNFDTNNSDHSYKHLESLILKMVNASDKKRITSRELLNEIEKLKS